MDLESVLCSREGFGLESATFLQRAICRIKDGAPLDDLLARGNTFDRRCVETAIGCDVSLLPIGAPPVEVVDLEPVRCGKSLRMAALAVTRSQTVDVGIIKPGEEPPRISILANQLDQASAIRGHLNIINERPALRALLIGEDADSIILRHPSGCPIEIRVIAAQRGGYSLAARWAASVLFDEAPGWYSTDKIVSLEESRDQAIGRLLPGAQNDFDGSKWQPSGLCYQAHAEHHGKPSPEMVVISPQEVDGVPPAQQLNPAHWTDTQIARVRKASPRSFSMHVMNLFGAAATAAYALEDVTAAGAPRPATFHDGPHTICCDPSKLIGTDRWAVTDVCWRFPRVPPFPDDLLAPLGRPGVGRVMSMNVMRQKDHNFWFENAWILQRPDGSEVEVKPSDFADAIDDSPYLVVNEAITFDASARLEDIEAQLAQLIGRYRPTQAVTDYGGDTAWLINTLRKLGIHNVHAFSWSEQQRRSGFEWLGRLIADRRIQVTQEDLRRDLSRIESVLTAQGKVSYRARRNADGHCDLASCLVSYSIGECEELLTGSPHRRRGGVYQISPEFTGYVR